VWCERQSSDSFTQTPVVRSQDSVAAEGRVRRDTSFTSARSPRKIMAVLEEVLEELPLGFRVLSRAYKIRIKAPSVGLPVQCTIRVYGLAPHLYVIEFRKKQGDFLEFHRLFRAIRLRCGDLVREEEENSSSEDPFDEYADQIQSRHAENA
jgi:hypothetical protein